jgi:hypothetical protein
MEDQMMTVKILEGDHPEKNQYSCPLEHLSLVLHDPVYFECHDQVSSLPRNHHRLSGDFDHQNPFDSAVVAVVVEVMLIEGTNRKNTFHERVLVVFEVLCLVGCLHRTKFPLRCQRTESHELEKLSVQPFRRQQVLICARSDFQSYCQEARVDSMRDFGATAVAAVDIDCRLEKESHDHCLFFLLHEILISV